MAPPPHILIVEDEPKLASLLSDYLTADGFTVSVLHDGSEVIPFLQASPPALMLLDLMLPSKNGIDICRETRAFSSVPIIMVTARVEEVDRLLGLELGADDYICKPFSPREVVARVKVILRRIQPKDDPVPTGLQLNTDAFTAAVHGVPLDVTPAEFRLLMLFSRHPRKVFSRDQLLGALYDDQRVVTDRTIDTHIKNLRRKLEQADTTTRYITSVYGVGYRFDPQPVKEE